MNPVYLDNNATTPPAPEVVQEVAADLALAYGNPSSAHGAGEQAKRAVTAARNAVARLVGCQPDELVFTGGGTESDNTAVRSAVRCLPHRRHIVCSAIEHDAVQEPVKEMERLGYRVSWVQPDARGAILPEAVAAMLTPDTCLVAVMLANNETGVVNNVSQIGAVAKRAGAQFLVDATQALGKIPVNFRAMNAEYMVASAHKMHGPKGCGLLAISSRCAFEPMLVGGGQEGKRRAGTENTPGICGFGAACELAMEPRAGVAAREIEGMRNQLENALKNRFGGHLMLLGNAAPRVWNTSLVAFRDTFNRELQDWLSAQGIFVGIGSACSCLKDPKPSATVKAMRVPPPFQLGTIRFSFNRYQAPSMGGDPRIVQRVVQALEAWASRHHRPRRLPA